MIIGRILKYLQSKYFFVWTVVGEVIIECDVGPTKKSLRLDLTSTMHQESNL